MIYWSILCAILSETRKLEFNQSRYIMLYAIAWQHLSLTVFWGWLSDKIGRKWIMLIGMLIAILTYRAIKKFYEHTSEKYIKRRLASIVDLPVGKSLIAAGDSVF